MKKELIYMLRANPGTPILKKERRINTYREKYLIAKFIFIGSLFYNYTIKSIYSIAWYVMNKEILFFGENND